MQCVAYVPYWSEVNKRDIDFFIIMIVGAAINMKSSLNKLALNLISKCYKLFVEHTILSNNDVILIEYVVTQINASINEIH